ncbi:MAG: hypothetical protein II968_05050 [Selenomonadaceae bacterium]|nr:hypothetical protein [Selenomonadaceae bacterium]MBQ6759384.1 hypothetical protein [Selenomonadaceae bacterium]
MELYFQIILAVINGALTLVIGWVGYKLRKHRKREEERQAKELARDNLQLAVARNMLIRECNRYLDKGYAPLYAIASVAEMYDAYHKLGGNGAVTGAYHDFMQLPHAPRRDSNAQMER